MTDNQIKMILRLSACTFPVGSFTKRFVRGMNDAGRFAHVLGLVSGKRLTYEKLTDNEKFRQLRLWKRIN